MCGELRQRGRAEDREEKGATEPAPNTDQQLYMVMQVFPVILSMVLTELTGQWSSDARDQRRLDASSSSTVLAFFNHIHETCPGFRKLVQVEPAQLIGGWLSCVWQEEISELLNFVSLIMYELTNDTNGLAAQVWESINVELKDEAMSGEMSLPLVSKIVPALRGWMYLAMEDAMLYRKDAQVQAALHGSEE